jgi:hypothetical protein
MWFQRWWWRMLAVMMVVSVCVQVWRTWEHPPQYPLRPGEHRP